jgi:anti-sigma factor RsiW
MTDRNSPVTEDELHAYVDGELPADRRDAVEAWLAAHPEDAGLVAAWRAQADAIRARYGAVADEPVPARLALDHLTRNGGRWRAFAAAAAIAAFVAGGAIGWMARGASAAAPSSAELFTADALSAHALYIAEVRHPIEVKAAEEHLLPWLSKRIGTPLRVPDLERFGLKMLGGRLLPGVSAPAALFMYESATGERYTLYCSHLDASPSALRYTLADKFAAVHWVDDDYGYVISGPAERERLMAIAKSAFEQMEKRAPGWNRSDAGPLLSRRGS